MPAEVSGIDAVPIRKRCSGVTGTLSSRFANPKPSAHTIWPRTPTATDIPGRFSSDKVVRTKPRPRPTAAAHFCDGGEFVMDAILSGSGFTLVAVRRTYTSRLGTATISTPTPSRKNEIHLGTRVFHLPIP